MTSADLVLNSVGMRPSGSGPATPEALSAIPDPVTGHPLAVASIDVSDRCVCPQCAGSGKGAYVSFVADLRLAFACSQCLQLVWLAGA